MPVVSPPPTREEMARAIGATRAIFFGAGLLMASWGPLVPFAKARLDLDDRGLGLLLLCLGLGSVAAMPFSGALAAKLGCRRVILSAGSVASTALPFLAFLTSVPAMAVVLAIFGAGIGTVDVVMNIQATIVERDSGRAMMSGFHGLFSVGGFAGALAMTIFLGAGLVPWGAVLIVSVLAAGLVVVFRKGLLPTGGDPGGPPFVVPRGPAIVIGALCFILFLTEGAMLDWSGLFLIDRGLGKEFAGIGYVAFAITMTIGRLTGDRVVHALGPKKILVSGGLIAASGLALAVFVPFWPVALLGFALVGVGAANTVPVLFSAAGAQRAMPANLAVAAVTTMGYGGILIGPAAIGFVARASNLSIALALVAVALVGVAIVGPRIAGER